MDVSKASALPQIAQSVPRGPHTDATQAELRERDAANANSQIQARYGEKPKEARPVKKSLDKDDFMRIMLSEMKHQDPTKPMDADKMANQMAQLTTVEQIKNMGTAIEKMADKNTASDRMAMSNMIGKSVTVDKGRFNHQKGTISPLNFDLPVDAEKVKLTVLDEHGEEVVSRPLEPQKAGPNVYNWDGLNSSNLPAPSASYTIRIEAEDKKGARISVNPISKEKIIGVTFEGGDANFLVGDPKSPQRVGFKSVTRIESDSEPRRAAPAAKAASGDSAGEAKVEGNQPFDLPPGLQEKFKNELAAKPAGGEGGQPIAQAEAAEQPVKAEGFANGLND